MRQKAMFKYGWILMLVVGLALLVPAGAALATFVSIDTNSNAIDAAWSTVTVFQQKVENPGVPNGYDIKQVWVARESDNSFWYFRADLYGELPNDNYSSIEARIDCTGDSAFTATQDKISLFYHAAPANDMDNVIECAGSDYPLCSTDGESQGWDFGEGFAVGDGTYSYEWKADTSDIGGIDWSACGGQRTIQFATVNDFGAVIDSTSPRQFDVPTVVQVSSLKATQNRGLLPAALLGLGLVLGAALIGWLAWYRQAAR